MNDGTQERTLDPPDLSLSDAELRECERAARKGFCEMDKRAEGWLEDQIADVSADIARLVRAILQEDHRRLSRYIAAHCLDVRDRYIAECAEDYWPDLIDQAAHAQEA